MEIEWAQIKQYCTGFTVILLIIIPFIFLMYQVHILKEAYADAVMQNNLIAIAADGQRQHLDNCYKQRDNCLDKEMNSSKFALYQQAGNTLCYELHGSTTWIFRYDLETFKAYCVEIEKNIASEIKLIKNAGWLTYDNI